MTSECFTLLRGLVVQDTAFSLSGLQLVKPVIDVYSLGTAGRQGEKKLFRYGELNPELPRAG